MSRQVIRLPAEVNRILYVRNLPYKITSEEMYDIFGKFGAIRQIRKYCYFKQLKYLYFLNYIFFILNNKLNSNVFLNYNHIQNNTYISQINLLKILLIIITRGTHGDKKGTAFVVYEDIYDAKNAFDNLSGFNVAGRYLIVLYYQPQKMQERQDLEFQRKQIEKLREQQRQQQQ